MAFKILFKRQNLIQEWCLEKNFVKTCAVCSTNCHSQFNGEIYVSAGLNNLIRLDGQQRQLFKAEL